MKNKKWEKANGLSKQDLDKLDSKDLLIVGGHKFIKKEDKK